jgi:hypothetical protein
MKRPRESLSAVASVNGGEDDMFEPLAQPAVHTVEVSLQRLSSSRWGGSHSPALTDDDADEQGPTRPHRLPADHLFACA